jgi:hypothetical protein
MLPVDHRSTAARRYRTCQPISRQGGPVPLPLPATQRRQRHLEHPGNVLLGYQTLIVPPSSRSSWRPLLCRLVHRLGVEPAAETANASPSVDWQPSTGDPRGTSPSGHPGRASIWARWVNGPCRVWMRAVGKGVQAASLPAAQPAVDGLAADAIAHGHLGHREPVPQHLHDGVEALLCHCELQEHTPDLLASPLVGEAQEGQAVVSTINRNSGTHRPVSTRQASTGRAHPPLDAYCRQIVSKSLGVTSRHAPDGR